MTLRRGVAWASALIVLAATLALVAGVGSVSATGVNCSDFANQAAAQAFFLSDNPAADPEGLDTDHDGIACESLPCPCSTTAPQPPPTPSPTPEPPTPTPSPEQPEWPLKVDAKPTRVAMGDMLVDIPWTISGADPTDIEWCNLKLRNEATGHVDATDIATQMATGAAEGTLMLMDFELHPGMHRLEADCDMSGTATDEVDIRWASRVALQEAWRHRRRVTLQGVVRRYTAKAMGFGRWSGATVQVQRRLTSGWRTVRTVQADRRGQVEVTVRSPRRGVWRLHLAGDSATWAASSPGVRR